LVTRPKSYDQGVLRAIAVTPVESTRTEFSGGSSDRLVKNALKKLKIARKMPISMPP
jgi:hypothetical protein